MTVTVRSKFLMSAVVVAAVGAFAFHGCRKPSAPRPNILLISMDTCRADHLGCYGNRDAGTRHLDALATQSVLFENVLTPVPLTLPAHSSMMTGMVPPVHGVHDNFRYRLSDSAITLAERLKAAGYTTVAAVGSVVLGKQYGLSQGFDIFDDDMSGGVKSDKEYPERRGQETSRFATEWLSQRGDEPFFMFLHFYDPHHPYVPPEPFKSMFPDDPYSGEIAYTDNCIGAVTEKLKSLGLFHSTLIVVTSDHGEGLGQHDERLHGFYIYHSTMKVPLIIKPPQWREAKRITQKAGLIDVTPTILSLAGLDPLDGAQGIDLSPLLDGSSAATQRYFFGQSLMPTKYGCTPLLSLESDRWKYIQAARPELYDLQRDPGEKMNLVEQEPQTARTMRNRLKNSVQGYLSRSIGADAVVPDASAIVKMRALGYAGGEMSEAFDFDVTADEPKDFFPVLEKYERAKRYMNMKNYPKAREVALEALAIGAGTAHVYSRLGQIAFFENKIDEAIAHYTQAVRLRPQEIDWHLDLGLFLAQAARHDEAIEQYQTAIEIITGSQPVVGTTGPPDSGHPLLPKLHFALGISLRKVGRNDEASASFKETLRLDPDYAGAREALSSIGG